MSTKSNAVVRSIKQPIALYPESSAVTSFSMNWIIASLVDFLEGIQIDSCWVLLFKNKFKICMCTIFSRIWGELGSSNSTGLYFSYFYDCECDDWWVFMALGKIMVILSTTLLLNIFLFENMNKLKRVIKYS